ncbi:hypothetical protein KAJ27_24205 [bacterium]|nr:hypothetical protein [bacterium]
MVEIKKKQKLILFHSVSVGEINAAEWLIKKYISDNYQIVISTTCEDGKELIEKKYPEAQVVVFPLDFIFAVKNFINRIEPDLVIICETDFWPAFLYTLSKRQIPVILLNGRISKKAGIYFRLFKAVFDPLFHLFNHMYLQSEMDRFILEKIGIKSNKMTVTGNTKLNLKIIETGIIKTELKIVVAGSTHKHDEEMLYELLPFIDLLIIAPRKLSRINEVSKCFTSLDKMQKPVLYSENQNILNTDSKIIIVDTIGDLQNLYNFATISAYVRGGFESTGLHNILEPLRMKKPVVFGSNIYNFKDICIEIIKQEIAFKVNNSQELVKLVNDFIEKYRKKDYSKKIELYFIENSKNGEIIYNDISNYLN